MEVAEENPFRFMRVTATPDCTFACQYCNPRREGDLTMMSTPELLDTIMAGFQLGIGVVHLTGGEPSMRKDIVQLVRGIRQIGISTIEMTTNGLPYWSIVDKLRDAGLTGVNISIDTLNSVRFTEITGVDALPQVLQAIDQSRTAFERQVALNVVVMKQNIEEVPDFLDFAAHNGVMVRFCELTPVGPYMRHTPEFFVASHVSKDQIIEVLQSHSELKGITRETTDRQNVHAEYYQLGGNYDEMAVGLITPYSNGWPCGKEECTRLRIGPTSANSCIIYPGKNLRGLTFEEKKQVLQELIQERRTQMETDTFPQQHKPAYLQYRFGIPENT